MCRPKVYTTYQGPWRDAVAAAAVVVVRGQQKAAISVSCV